MKKIENIPHGIHSAHIRFRGYTLIELIVATGLFSVVMLLASSAYFLMIGINRNAQSIATGINDLSFVLETMTRTIRTGTAYNCNGSGDCSGASSFSFKDTNGSVITYSWSSNKITKNGIDLTDPNVITITGLKFYTTGTGSYYNHSTHAVLGDIIQPRVTMIVSGEVSSGPGKRESFTVQTGATMRGTDL